MKRDMNLVREILIWTENQEHGRVSGNPKIEGYAEEEVAYHVHLMEQAHLVKAFDTTSMADKSPQAILIELTWDGYEFLDAARDETIWVKAKNTIFTTTKNITFDILLEWLKAEARRGLGLPT